MRRLLAILPVAMLLPLMACSGEAGSGASAPAAGDEASLEGTVTVLAAASLTDAFTELAEAFEAANPGVTVELSFAGSSSLREQILAGAPADVFAAADESTMEQVVEAGAVDEAQAFASNSLQIVVPAGNPGRIAGLEDFGDTERLIGLCAEEVPCGRLGREVLDAADITPSPDTNEPDVRALLTRVEAGELDAGLVYVTDVISAGDGVEGIIIPKELNLVATHPIGILASSGNPDAAAALVELVLSVAGQEILDRYGFGPP